MTHAWDLLPAMLRPWVEQALPVWMGGGWAMVPLALTGLIMYTLGLSSLFQLLLLGARHSPDRAWRRWLKRPDQAHGPIGRIISEAMESATLHEMETFFSLLVCEGVNPFARRLQIMKVCVTSAPLLGLLGTVTGMLTTFGGLAKGGGGEQTMGIISKGLSEALITTETGLVVALTGVMIQFFLTRQQQRYEKVVAHVETLCMGEFQRRLVAASGAKTREEKA
ncbi:MAG TPA: MotA/TolQ/ExbB proton channel family protein [Anaerolineae bacterium]|nr:MotA/TolQ/ExbB proton channel family protein [Anaerolineae bacterium]